MESDWQAPACRLDDEDERIAYYSAPITTSATTTASSIAVAAPTEDEKPVDAPKPKTAAAVANRAEPVAPQTARRPVPVRMKRAEIEYEAPRVRVPQRPRAATRRPSQREGGSEPRLSGAGTPASDGFGSSALRGTQRISAHGG